MKINPTVARMLWYRPSTGDTDLVVREGQPLAAILAHVASDTRVNLAVIDADGTTHRRTNVLLLQEDDENPDQDTAFATWMPYQRGQAAKNDGDLEALKARIEVLEAKIGEGTTEVEEAAPPPPYPGTEDLKGPAPEAGAGDSSKDAAE